MGAGKVGSKVGIKVESKVGSKVGSEVGSEVGSTGASKRPGRSVVATLALAQCTHNRKTTRYKYRCTGTCAQFFLTCDLRERHYAAVVNSDWDWVGKCVRAARGRPRRKNINEYLYDVAPYNQKAHVGKYELNLKDTAPATKIIEALYIFVRPPPLWLQSSRTHICIYVHWRVFF